MLADLGRAIARHIPMRSDYRVSRRLVRRANAARDARQYHAAAALFEEALGFTPGNARVHIQCGHMFKELGDFDSAGRHYGAAERLRPNDADLALQLGHFHKVAGRPDAAEAAYRRALDLRPGWAEAADELARIGNSSHESLHLPGGDLDWLVPELLPQAALAGAPFHRDTIQVRRLGGRRMRSRWGMLKVLRGVEAIRGFCIASTPLSELRVLVDGAEIRRVPLEGRPIADSAHGQAKYVFNLWHDFSGFPFGRYTIELRFIATRSVPRAHRETILIAPPEPETAHPGSDALVTLPPGGTGTIEDQVNARASMVRSTARALLPDPVRAILVQRVDQLGDLVCSVPAIRRLRALFPDARLIGLTTAANAGLAATLGLFDAVVIAGFHEDPAERRRVMPIEEQQRLHDALAPYDFDLAIDMGEGSESRPLLLLSGARFLYGFKDREYPWLSAGFELNAHDPVNRLEIMPPSRKILALVEALAAMRDARTAPLRRDEAARPDLSAYGIGPDTRYAVLHTGARLAYSRWPHFGELARLLLAETDLHIVVMADDADGFPAPHPPSGRIHIITGRVPFDDFDALLAYAAIFVGNDSGPKHLAALRGTKVVSLHMARLNWSEWGQELDGTIISRRVPCAGCAISDAPEDCGKDFACLRLIRPEEVMAAIHALLQPDRASALLRSRTDRS